MVPYSVEPLVADLMVAIENILSVPVGTQRLVFKGQSLHEFPREPLRNFGVTNSNKIKCIGRKAYVVK
jgi:hypothetical protein